MSMSVEFHLDPMNAPTVQVHKHSDGGGWATIRPVDLEYEHLTIHGSLDQLEALGRDIINGVAALRAAGPLPDDDDDDEDDEDATQPEPEAVALLPETALVDAKGK